MISHENNVLTMSAMEVERAGGSAALVGLARYDRAQAAQLATDERRLDSLRQRLRECRDAKRRRVLEIDVADLETSISGLRLRVARSDAMWRRIRRALGH